MHEHDLAYAISALTAELREQHEERKRALVTKTDLAAAEKRIIAAFSGIRDSDVAKATAELKASSDPLKAAVEANQP